MTPLSQRNPQRLAPQILDEVTKTEPDREYAQIPISLTGYDEGFRKVTYSMLANAVNFMAWWLTDTLGSGKDFETLSYIGPNDLMHVVLVLSAVKAGYKVSTVTSVHMGLDGHCANALL